MLLFCGRAVAAEWQRARNNGDVPALWPLLTRTATRSTVGLLALIPPSVLLFVVYLALRPRFVWLLLVIACLMLPLVSKLPLFNVSFRPWNMLLGIRLKLAVDVTSAERFHEFQQLWKRIVRRAHLFVSPVDSPGVFDLGDLQVSCPDSWPKHNDLLQVIRVLESSVSRSHLLEQQTRLRSWRQS